MVAFEQRRVGRREQPCFSRPARSPGVTHISVSSPLLPALLTSGSLQGLRFCDLPETVQPFFFFFSIYLCMHAAPGLSCGTWGFRCGTRAS